MASEHPLHETDPAWRICSDCSYPFEAERPACPNPACYPGMGEELRRRREWTAQRDLWVFAKQAEAAGTGVFWQPGALQAQYEREHPFE